LAHAVAHCLLKVPIGSLDENGNLRQELVRRRQIESVVAVEIGRDHGIRLGSDRVVLEGWR